MVDWGSFTLKYAVSPAAAPESASPEDPLSCFTEESAASKLPNTCFGQYKTTFPDLTTPAECAKQCLEDSTCTQFVISSEGGAKCRVSHTCTKPTGYLSGFDGYMRKGSTAGCGAPPAPPAARGVDLLSGSGSRGLSMARTLGSEDANQVTQPGRKVLIGWTGPADGKAFGGQGSAQSLPRELSLDSGSNLLQRFVGELQQLRQQHMTNSGFRAGLRAEVLAVFKSDACSPGARAAPLCSVTVLGDGVNGTVVTLRPDLGLVTVDATSQGNTAVRGGPLPAANSNGEWSIHAIVDHSIVEVIVNNATAFVVYAAPEPTCAGQVVLSGDGQLDVWTLAAANN